MSSQSTKPSASQSSSGLSSGAIAGIIIAAIVACFSLLGLVVIGIRHAKRQKDSKTEERHFINGYGASETGNGSAKLELDGNRVNPELSSQEMRHEMI